MKINSKLTNYSLLTMAILSLLLNSGCLTDDSEPVAESATPVGEETAAAASTERYVFGWGNLSDEVASPRGGSTRGTPVTYADANRLPLDTIASAGSAYEKDRAAILSLQGDYKVSFHFMEALGLLPDHEPERSYHSWATEKVFLLEDTGDFISLQHILVMYFEDDNGEMSGPFLVKHWRQDWTYEDTDLHTYRGDNTWARDTRSADDVKESWSQSVWQVDDSPRYEVLGKWDHSGNRSIWTSESFWRPLPRREYSIRDDYNVMDGYHRISITPKGWLHEQNSWKRVAGENSDTAEFLAQEIGINRYERITSPSLAKADEYWEKTHPYWEAVRTAWNGVYAEHDRFSLSSKVDDKSQFEHHFQFAGKLNEGEPYDFDSARAFIKETISKYLNNGDGSSGY